MVTGLENQTKATDKGRLTLTKIAIAAAMIICEGSGIQAQKRPTAKAPDTLCRLKCHNLGE